MVEPNHQRRTNPPDYYHGGHGINVWESRFTSIAGAISQRPSLEDVQEAPSAAAPSTPPVAQWAPPLLADRRIPRVLQVSYAPITFLHPAANTSSAAALTSTGQFGFSTHDSFSRLRIKITSANASEPALLSGIQVSYWFQGDMAAASWQPAADGGGGGDIPYEMKCLYTTPELPGGCGALLWNFSRGLPRVPGAAFLLNLGFRNGSGALTPQYDVSSAGRWASSTKGTAIGAETAGGGNASASKDTHPQLRDVEILISIESCLSAAMDPRQDYSFLNTPAQLLPEQPDLTAFAIRDLPPAPADNLSVVSGGASPDARGAPRIVVPRQLSPNSRISANYTGVLAWGSPPDPNPSPPPTADVGQQQPVTDINSLPQGSSCDVRADGNLSCGVRSTYCCSAMGPIVTSVPPDWVTLLNLPLPPPVDTGQGRRKPPAAVTIGVPVIVGIILAALSAVALCLLVHRRRGSRSGGAESGKGGGDDDSGQQLGLLPGRHEHDRLRGFNRFTTSSSEHAAAYASELRSVLDAGWWQDNSLSKGEPLGLGLLPKFPTVPTRVYKAYVVALLPPTTQELKNQLTKRLTSSALGGGRGSPGREGQTNGGGCGTSSLWRSRAAAVAAAAATEVQDRRGWAAATLAAAELAGFNNDDIRLRFLVQKCNTWTGRVGEGWELVPDYATRLLLLPPEDHQGRPAELEPLPCSSRQPQPPATQQRALMAWTAALAPGTVCRGTVTSAVLPGLPVTLSLEPIELDVDYEAEVAPNLGRLIGAGGFGRVYEGLWRGRKVAVKTVTIDKEAQREALAKEAQITARFRNCDRIVQLLGASLGLDSSAAALPADAAAEIGSAPRGVTHGGAMEGGARKVTSTAPAPPATPSVVTGAREGDNSVAGPDTGHLAAAVARPASGQVTSAQLPQQQKDGSGQRPKQSGRQQTAALIMELCEGGNLGDRVHHPHMRRLEYLEVLQLSRDVAEGLAQIHRFGVLHRDLKPGNVLLDSKGRAKIADFGISRLRDPVRSCAHVTQPAGTFNYMAPELFNGTRVDERADLYSLGCIMYEALTRKVPFEHLWGGSGMGGDGGDVGGNGCGSPVAIIVAVAIHGKRPTLPDWVPRGLAELISACWADDPKARPTALQVYARLGSLIAEEVERRAAKAGIAWRRFRLHHPSSSAERGSPPSLGIQTPPSPPPSPSPRGDMQAAPASSEATSSGPQLPPFQPVGGGRGGGGAGPGDSAPRRTAAAVGGRDGLHTAVPGNGSSSAPSAKVACAAAAARRPLHWLLRTPSRSQAAASGGSSTPPPSDDDVVCRHLPGLLQTPMPPPLPQTPWPLPPQSGPASLPPLLELPPPKPEPAVARVPRDPA